MRVGFVCVKRSLGSLRIAMRPNGARGNHQEEPLSVSVASGAGAAAAAAVEQQWVAEKTDDMCMHIGPSLS